MGVRIKGVELRETVVRVTPGTKKSIRNNEVSVLGGRS